ncbi:MAG TPA: shikimate kinase [Blastocatellia bacterium]|nr:shikimate kinase [Blastocatellia bacterium]
MTAGTGERGDASLPPIVFLVGFMGAGKTTVGQVLAGRIGYQFFDLDQIIENQTGRLVRDIFREDGEDEFRRIERAALASCARTSNAVIALGGGAFISAENRAVVRKLGTTVWLDCPLAVCLKRLAGDETRPLLRSQAEMVKLLNERMPFYEKADFTVRADAEPDAVVDSVLALLAR